MEGPQEMNRSQFQGTRSDQIKCLIGGPTSRESGREDLAQSGVWSGLSRVREEGWRGNTSWFPRRTLDLGCLWGDVVKGLQHHVPGQDPLLLKGPWCRFRSYPGPLVPGAV